jgi:hypothetical protein
LPHRGTAVWLTKPYGDRSPIALGGQVGHLVTSRQCVLNAECRKEGTHNVIRLRRRGRVVRCEERRHGSLDSADDLEYFIVLRGRVPSQQIANPHGFCGIATAARCGDEPTEWGLPESLPTMEQVQDPAFVKDLSERREWTSAGLTMLPGHDLGEPATDHTPILVMLAKHREACPVNEGTCFVERLEVERKDVGSGHHRLPFVPVSGLRPGIVGR